MDVPTTDQVRKAFVNSSRSKAASATFPSTWPPTAADHAEVIGWVDPKAPRRAYLVVGPPTRETAVAIELRMPSAPPRGKTMCDLCQTTDAAGAALVVAPRAGSRGRAGDSVGICICTDFACSSRVREPLKANQVSVSGRPDTRVDDLVERVIAFVERVTA